MIWRNVTATAPPNSIQDLEQCLWELGAVSVTLTDGGGDPLYEPGPGETPLWKSSHVVGLFEDDVSIGDLRRQINARGFTLLATEELADRRWEREWLKHFQPMQFGECLWVCPHELSVVEPGAVVVKMDPGLAFGTGSHATTRLCLEWLATADLEGKNVLDFGCGSGILGVAACLLGAARTAAVDNDPQALIATKQNAVRNAVSEKILVSLPEQMVPQRFDVVIANILAQPLIELSEMLIRALGTNADLVLSGIMSSQKDWVRSASITACTCGVGAGWLAATAL